MRLLDSYCEESLIKPLFNRLKTANKNVVETKNIEKLFNIFKKEAFRDLNSDSFKENFITHIKNHFSYHELKALFENLDLNNSGILSKTEFCSGLSSTLKLSCYSDDDIMMFARINHLYKGSDKIKYNDFLDIIFIDGGNRINLIINFLIDEYKKSKCEIQSLFHKVKNSNDFLLSYKELADYIKKHKDIKNPIMIISKFDLDQDGKIGLEDMKSVLDKYMKSSFMKYENGDDHPELNIFPNEIIDEKRFKQIVRDIKHSLNVKAITLVGLFKQLDSDNDGFVNLTDFNKNIDNFIYLGQSLKDQFFSFLDIRKNGIIDQETFLQVMKEPKELVICENDWIKENDVIEKFDEWLKENKNLNENEVFVLMDKDCDGSVSLEDLTNFLTQSLKIRINTISQYVIERVMQKISISIKTKTITFSDLTRYLANRNSTKEMRSTINFPISLKNKIKDWMSKVFEKLGLYINDNFKSLDNFFIKYSNSKDKIVFEDFKNFLVEHNKCFEGFNMTNDEYLRIFSALDNHKKKYLTLHDLKIKLGDFEIIELMHSEMKAFFKKSFVNVIEAIKYIKSLPSQDSMYNSANSSINQLKFDYITKKELFNGINNFFPKKYNTNQVLNYISKFFKENISLSDFGKIFYESEGVDNNNYIKDKKKSGFLNRSRSDLRTPFDHNPLEKFKRVLKYSNYEPSEFLKIYQIVSDGRINTQEFRNMIKRLNLGYSPIEIDKLLSLIERDKDGLIDLNDFIQFTKKQDNFHQVNQNLSQFVKDLKGLIYKYYGNPILAFQFNDPNNTKLLDFEKFNSIIRDLFAKDSKETPNFALIRNVYDYIDIRKDGKIDFKEWTKTFAYQEAKLEKNYDRPDLKILRNFESSRQNVDIYGLIYKNRKLIRDQAGEFFIRPNVILSNNLINILKDAFPNLSINLTNWKIVVSIADRDKSGQIDLDLFFKLISASSKISISVPRLNNGC